MNDVNEIVTVTEEYVPVSKGDREELLDQVDDIQKTRFGRHLTAKDVPHILLPYQARWHADNSVVRLAEKSRRIGWSWGALAAEGAMEAALPKGNPRGMDQFYMGYNRAMAAENIGDVVFFAQAFGYAVSQIDVGMHREHATYKDNNGETKQVVQDITSFKTTFTSGHKYEALSSNPHSWRGRQGHARVDEAAFHQNLQAVVKAALAFRLWGGRISVVSTHNGDENQFNQWCRDIKAGKLNWSLHHIDFDQALSEGFYKRICLVTGKAWSLDAEAQFRQEAFDDYPDQEDANEELLCIPKRGSGAYFSRILIEQCQIADVPQLYWAMPAEFVLDESRIAQTDQWINDNLKPVIDNMRNDQRTVYGQDFGRSGDLSIIWVLQNDAPRHWKLVVQLELRNLPFDVQARIRNYLLQHLPLLHHAKFDARGNGHSHAEGAVQLLGPQKVEAVQLSGAWYNVHFPKYKQAYEDKSIAVADSEDIIADHRIAVLVKGNPRMSDTRIKGSDGKFRHGDSTVAGLMAWSATLEDGEPAFGVDVEHDPDVYKPDSANGRIRSSMFR